MSDKIDLILTKLFVGVQHLQLGGGWQLEWAFDPGRAWASTKDMDCCPYISDISIGNARRWVGYVPPGSCFVDYRFLAIADRAIR